MVKNALREMEICAILREKQNGSQKMLTVINLLPPDSGWSHAKNKAWKHRLGKIDSGFVPVSRHESGTVRFEPSPQGQSLALRAVAGVGMQNLIEKLGLGERAASMVVWVGLSILLLVVVVALAVWLVRTLRSPLNLGGSPGRSGRPQRLAITDAFNLDRDGRKLVIVRRDNVEHLLLIGGPNDVLVESSIVRGERSLRDRAGRGMAESEFIGHDAPHTSEQSRPDAPAPVSAPMPPATPAATAPTMTLTPPPFRPATPPPAAKPAQPAAPRLDDEFERALSAMQNIQRQEQPRAPQPAAQAPAYSAPPAPAFTPPAIPVAPVMSAPAAPPPAPATPVTPAPVAPAPARTEPVSEMARRLNEVLQKPLSGSLRPPFNKPIPPVPGTMNSAPRPAPAAPTPPAPQPLLPPLPPELDFPAEQNIPAPQPPAPPAEAAAPAPAPSPSPAPKALENELEMDLLEEEMARLLGRPAPPKKPGEP